MAYDEELASRVRRVLAGWENVTEKKMFGGLAFLLGDHMCCGIVDDRLMLRLGREGSGHSAGKKTHRRDGFHRARDPNHDLCGSGGNQNR